MLWTLSWLLLSPSVVLVLVLVLIWCWCCVKEFSLCAISPPPAQPFLHGGTSVCFLDSSPPPVPPLPFLYILYTRPPALHFYAKRRAADPDTTSTPTTKRPSARLSVSNLPVAAEGDGGSGGGGGGVAVGAGEDSGGGYREEQEQSVYYYDVATIWIRPVDLKVGRRRGRERGGKGGREGGREGGRDGGVELGWGGKGMNHP